MTLRKKQISNMPFFRLGTYPVNFLPFFVLILLTSCGNPSHPLAKSYKSGSSPVSMNPAVNANQTNHGSLTPTYDCSAFLNIVETVDLCRWVTYVRNQAGQIKLMNLERLNLVAQKQAEDMSKFQYLSHSNKLGQALDERLRLANVPFTRAEEEIAFGYYTGVSVFNFWFSTPESKLIHLDPKFTRQGIGYYKGYWSRIVIN